tara:strand:+ start:1 stop:2283 length:2283 start_codon:yes stop_codon:yes gene_type:complete
MTGSAGDRGFIFGIAGNANQALLWDNSSGSFVIGKAGSQSPSDTSFNIGDTDLGIVRLGMLTASKGVRVSAGDVYVASKIIHDGDTDTFINFTTDDINFQAGGVNFLDLTEDDSQDEVTFNEGGVDIDFRVETADESHMLFIEGSSNRMSIGDNTGSPGATLEIKNHATAGATGVPLLQLNNNDTDQQCVDINAGNIDANVVNITANDVTTARVLAIGADGLTTGNALYVDDNSGNTGTRNTALIIQNNAAALNAKALAIQSDGGKTGVKIDKNYSDTTEASVVGLDIDWDKTGASTSDNTMYGIQLDMDNTTATNGENIMYGLQVTPTLTHAADAGTPKVKGAVITATGGTNGTSTATGMELTATGADTNEGLIINCADGGTDLKVVSSADTGDYFQIQTTTHGATTFTTVDDNATAAHLTMTVDGDITLDPASAVVTVDGNLSASVNISGSAFYGDGANVTNVIAHQIKIGRGIGGGDANRVLFENGSNELAESGDLTFASNTLTVGNDVSIADKLIHTGDTDTHLKFGTDKIEFIAGGGELLTLIEDTQNIVTVGKNSSDTDFQVITAGNDNTIFAQGNTNRVGLGTSAPGAVCHISSSVTGDSTLRIDAFRGQTEDIIKVIDRDDNTAFKVEKDGVASFGNNLTVSGDATDIKSLRVAQTLKQESYSMGDSDYVIACANTGSALNVTISRASDAGSGRIVTIKGAKGDENTHNVVILRGHSGDTIDGQASLTISDNYGFKTLVSDGSSKWWVIGSS